MRGKTHTYSVRVWVCVQYWVCLMSVEQGPLLRLLLWRSRWKGEKAKSSPISLVGKCQLKNMGTFLFQQFPRLTFTSQWPIQHQVMPWHIQMGPVLKGYADTGWITKHKPQWTGQSEEEHLHYMWNMHCYTDVTWGFLWPQLSRSAESAASSVW